MAKSKWSQIEEKLTLVEGWARDGLIDKQIAQNLGIGYSTFKEYKKKYPTFLAALKKGKEVVDYEVENALLKRALGYEFEEQIFETKYDYSEEKFVEVMTKRVIKHVPPDTIAQIYWLKNRKPKQWRDKVDLESGKNMQRVQIINDLPKDDENGTS